MGYSPWGGKELDTTAVSEHACTHALYSPNDRIQCLHFCLSLICSFCNICTHILKTISPIGTGTVSMWPPTSSVLFLGLLC